VDVVLLDVLMPGMNGPQTLTALRQVNPAVRGIFIGDHTSEQLLGLGAAHILSKPFPRLDQLVTLLR
jgi:CheY-like chemotaxis protein